MSEEKIKILLAEDDENLSNILKEYLELRNYSVTLCLNGKDALNAYMKDNFHICVFDIMMPIKDGFTLAKDIRNIDKKIPIIFLTAKTLKQDTIEGLKLDVDDYITKPFSMEELMLRIKAILRRSYENLSSPGLQGVFIFGKFTFDSNQQVLSIGNDHKKLTSKESDLLKLLCRNINNVVERTYALNMIWKNDSYYNARSMDVYITKLRKYLRVDNSVELINCHGQGFKLVVIEPYKPKS